MTKEHLSVIVGMAARDHKIEENELRVIYMLAKASDIARSEVDIMLKNPEYAEVPAGYSGSDRFEVLYHLIQVMKADGQVFKSEISFCEEMAVRLGYKRGVVKDLAAHIYSSPFVTVDRKMLIERAEKFTVR